MNFKKKHKIELVMAILTLIYALTMERGWLAEVKQTRKNNKIYANKTRYPYASVFRKGLPYLERVMINLWTLWVFIKEKIDKNLKTLQIFQKTIKVLITSYLHCY